jgi:hypothetical protein
MRALFLVLPIALLGCGSESITMEVNHFRAPCTGLDRQLCMQTREQGEADFGYFYDGIAGFNHRWGHTYTLEVEVTEVDDPPEDGSSLQYTLKSVVSDAPVAASTTFAMALEIMDLSLDGGLAGTLMSMTSATPFTCESQAVCDAVLQVNEAGQAADATFGYPDPVGLPLVLKSVAPR